MKIAGKTILQGELVDVLECEKCGARWTNQSMDCYHCKASLNSATIILEKAKQGIEELNVPKKDK